MAWASSTPVTLYFISCITVLEIERGILSVERKDVAQGLCCAHGWTEKY
jgi:hypothetical protein